MKTSAIDRVRSKASGLAQMAMTFALPHENKPIRLPSLPAALTATVSYMSDGTKGVSSSQPVRFALMRDAAYPVWASHTVTNTAIYGMALGGWTIPNTASYDLGSPAIGEVGATFGTGGTSSDYVVFGKLAGHTYIHVPYNAWFVVSVQTGADQSGKTLVADIEWYQLGELRQSTIALAGFAAGHFTFTGNASTGAAGLGELRDGNYPTGFVRLLNLRTETVAPTASASPYLQLGWTTDNNYYAGKLVANVTGTANNVMLPMFTAPEFGLCALPYVKTRATATALLLTNITQVMSKEGTVLAARLKDSVVDFAGFTTTEMNSTHPSQRYFGPLEKGLYSFTAPSQSDSGFFDAYVDRILSPAGSAYGSARPAFNIAALDVYNAIICTDYQVSSSTSLAVSSYTHLEFEVVSSIFTPGVSTFTLEQLHAAEVALLGFGFFHENPVHWAAIRSAAMAALRVVGPMVAPLVQQAGTALLNRGVKLLTGPAPGASRARQMPQDSLKTASRQPVPKKKGPTRAARRKLR